MLLIICILLLVAGIIWLIRDEWSVCALLLTIVGACALIISLVFIGINYINVDGYVEVNHIRRDMLVYQYENDMYDNDNDVGKKELIREIQDWNEDLAYYKNMQDDFWIGIYIPNIYDQFEPIDITK